MNLRRTSGKMGRCRETSLNVSQGGHSEQNRGLIGQCKPKDEGDLRFLDESITCPVDHYTPTLTAHEVKTGPPGVYDSDT